MKVCGNGNLTEKIKFQKEEIEKLKREIYGTDKNFDSKYIETFTREYVNYTQISSLTKLYRKAAASDIVYLGDYHALDKCQEFHAEFLENLAKEDRNLMLAVEMLYGRNQSALDALMNGEISEEDFLKRVRYEIEWGYQWKSYRKIFQIASRYGIKVWAIDRDSRNHQTISKRDLHAAKKIVSILEMNPGVKLVVIFGESHLAGRHLPHEVRKLLRVGSACKRELIVLQNVDSIYWKLASRGFEDEKVVRIGLNKFCVFTATPFAKYEAYRQVLESWKYQGSDDEEIYINSTIYNLIDVILDFIQVNKYEHCLKNEGRCIEFLVDAYPEVYSREDWKTFRSLVKLSKLNKSELQSILFHTKNNGSCYVPSINAIYIGKFDLIHGAEEATHFVNFVCKGKPFDGDGRLSNRGRAYRVDTFYTKVIEEALGYFGSKLIDPTRDQIKESIFLNPHLATKDIKQHLGLQEKDYEFIRRFIQSHKSFEKEGRRLEVIPSKLLPGIKARGKKYMLITHELGYILGEQLYSGYVNGKISRDGISKLFFMKFDAGGGALRKYLDLAERFDFNLPAADYAAARE